MATRSTGRQANPGRNAALLSPPELEARLAEFYDAVDEFNHGMYFLSHEVLEDLWMVTPLPERQFFQGVIQLAAAFVHLMRDEYPGIIKLLDLALEKLREFTPSYLGVDVATIVADVERVRAELTGLGPQRFLEWDARRIPRIVCRRTDSGHLDP